MILFDKLSPENFEMYASKNYDNPACECIKEFQEDANIRPGLIRKNLIKYARARATKNEYNLRSLLNDIMITINVFGAEAGARILTFKLEEDRMLMSPYLKSFLVFLNCPPITELRKVAVDKDLLQSLRNEVGV